MATRPIDQVGGMILIDRSFRVVAFDSRAAVILGHPNLSTGRSDKELPLPQEILTTLKRRTKNDFSEVSIWFRAGALSYICCVSMLQPCGDFPSQPLLALYITENSTAKKPELWLVNGMTGETISQIAAEYDLTERERQTLTGIALGLTCREMGERMNISPNTVRAFVRMIMAKVGVTRRAGIISKVLEHNQTRKGDWNHAN